MPYIDLTSAGVKDVQPLRDMIEALEKWSDAHENKRPFKVDLAGDGPHKLYLNELEDIRDGIIDNAIPTARARNRKLETIPTNIASSVIKL